MCDLGDGGHGGGEHRDDWDGGRGTGAAEVERHRADAPAGQREPERSGPYRAESGWAAGITADGLPRMLLSPWSAPEDDREDGIFFIAR